MAGFSSMDDFVSKVTVDGNFFRSDWNKNFLPTAAAVAGEWHSLFRGGGNPGADDILNLSLINNSEPTRLIHTSRMPS